ncbi:MAG: hypothetical protein ABIG96_05835 [Candidatus Micrarchaeota archaeon]
MVKAKRRVLKVCPNCGSSDVRPVKVVDEWASIEEQMDSSGGDKWECEECNYKGELIGVPEEEENPEDNEEPLEKPKIEKKEKVETAEKEKKVIPKRKAARPSKKKKGR